MLSIILIIVLLYNKDCVDNHFRIIKLLVLKKFQILFTLLLPSWLFLFKDTEINFEFLAKFKKD